MKKFELTALKPRLIDSNALYRELHNIEGCGAAPGTWEDGWDQAINEAIRLLERAPTLPRAPGPRAYVRKSEDIPKFFKED